MQAVQCLGTNSTHVVEVNPSQAELGSSYCILFSVRTKPDPGAKRVKERHHERGLTAMHQEAGIYSIAHLV